MRFDTSFAKKKPLEIQAATRKGVSGMGIAPRENSKLIDLTLEGNVKAVVCSLILLSGYSYNLLASEINPVPINELILKLEEDLEANPSKNLSSVSHHSDGSYSINTENVSHHSDGSYSTNTENVSYHSNGGYSINTENVSYHSDGGYTVNTADVGDRSSNGFTTAVARYFGADLTSKKLPQPILGNNVQATSRKPE